MFGKTVFLMKVILFWSLITATLVESGHQKRDVHHMIFLNDSRRPMKSHRYKDHDNHGHYKENRPKKSEWKPGGKKHGSSILEESAEESNEEVLLPKPKPKHHHYKRTNYAHRNHKRHNNQIHHKKHQQNNRHHHNNHQNNKPKESHKFPESENWIPMSSKEFFGTEQHQHIRNTGLGQHSQGYIQPIPLEITTPSSLQSFSSSFLFQSTLYPPLSTSFNQDVQKSPQPPLIGAVEPYSPFDYSILEQKPQNLNPSIQYQAGDVSASNVVNVKHSGGKDGNPFSIVIENSRENSENNAAEKGKKNEEISGKNEKAKAKVKRGRGAPRHRMRSKN